MEHVSLVAESESEDSDSDESYHPDDSSGTSSSDGYTDTENIAKEAGSDTNVDVWILQSSRTLFLNTVVKMASVKLYLMS